MTARQGDDALKAFRAALDAADAQCEATIAQAHRTIAVARQIRDAAALLAAARYQRVLDDQATPGCLHAVEDAPQGVEGCCAPVAAMAGAAL
jgi:hypothetical protein